MVQTSIQTNGSKWNLIATHVGNAKEFSQITNYFKIRVIGMTDT